MIAPNSIIATTLSALSLFETLLTLSYTPPVIGNVLDRVSPCFVHQIGRLLSRVSISENFAVLVVSRSVVSNS